MARTSRLIALVCVAVTLHWMHRAEAQQLSSIGATVWQEISTFDAIEAHHSTCAYVDMVIVTIPLPLFTYHTDQSLKPPFYETAERDILGRPKYTVEMRECENEWYKVNGMTVKTLTWQYCDASNGNSNGCSACR